MVIERFQTGLVFVLRLITIFDIHYRASTRPRTQSLKIHLGFESQVGTPIRRNLSLSDFILLIKLRFNAKKQKALFLQNQKYNFVKNIINF